MFISPEGDHYRTRLTHTLEACGIARNVARALGLNEDLTEAIGLGHDLGHPPFGHIGEEVLDACCGERYGERFRHNHHSLRVVERLERGLNLTEQVRDGILRHTGPELPATLEARIVRLVDRIAYINHDIDDALRAGVLAAPDLPAGRDRAARRAPAPSGSRRSCATWSSAPRRPATSCRARRSAAAMARLREFMFERVYLGPTAQQREAAHRADAARAVRPLRGAAAAAARGGRDRARARGRLSRRA